MDIGVKGGLKLGSASLAIVIGVPLLSIVMALDGFDSGHPRASDEILLASLGIAAILAVCAASLRGVRDWPWPSTAIAVAVPALASAAVALLLETFERQMVGHSTWREMQHLAPLVIAAAAVVVVAIALRSPRGRQLFLVSIATGAVGWLIAWTEITIRYG
jgi:predicted membrane channel-forming protein YqfA (hemolysin III family)